MKTKVAVEAIKGEHSINELAGRYQVHPTQIAVRKKQALERLPELFADGGRRGRDDDEPLRAQLYQEIGKLKVDLDFLEKNRAADLAEKRGMIEAEHPILLVRRQCRLPGLARSGLYYEPRGERAENLALMRLIDEATRQRAQV